MRKPVYAVRDSALQAFMNPFVAPSRGIALRSFMDEANRSESEMFKHPKDYELFWLGWFDEDSGHLEPLIAPESVARAADVLHKDDAASSGPLR